MRWPRGGRRRAVSREERERAYRTALQATLDGDLDAAEAELGAIVRVDSGEVDAYLALGRLYRRRGEVGRAIRIHQNLLLRTDLSHGQRDEALLGLARDFRAGGFLQRAIAAYQEVLERGAGGRESLEALVRLHADAREHTKALAVLRRLGKEGGDAGAEVEARLLVEAAEAAHAEGRSDDARKALKRALRRQPRLALAWARLGELEAERGRPKRALAAWKKVVEVDRRSAARIYPRLEATYAALGRPREFETLLRGLLAERSGDAAARLALARHLAARGEADAALAELAPLLQASPDDLPAQGARASILLAEGREADALKAFEELLRSLERQGLLAPREVIE